MKIAIRSQHDPAEIERLIRFAAEAVGVDHSATGVLFEDATYAYAGRAYSWKPQHSPFWDAHDVKRYVRLRIGGDKHFPLDNRVHRRRLLPEGTTEAEAMAKVKKIDPVHQPMLNIRAGRTRSPYGSLVAFISSPRYEIVTRQPYGGRKAAYYVIHNREEAIVAIAAHEFMHIDQYNGKRRPTEAECEAAALDALKAYRAMKRSNA